MNTLTIDELEISDIHLIKKMDFDQVELTFKVQSVSFTLDVEKHPDTIFRPRWVTHDKDEPCPLCDNGKRLSLCLPLWRKKEELFHQFVQLPSMRLEWLYIPHEDVLAE